VNSSLLVIDQADGGLRKATQEEIDAASEVNKFARVIIQVLDHLPKGSYFSVGRRDPRDSDYAGIRYWAQVLVTDEDGEESPRDYGEGKTWREALAAAGLVTE
jgi:hypothetical protein